MLLVGVIGFFTPTVLLFDVNTTHNIVHVVSGILGLLAGLTVGGSYAKAFNIVFGIVYGLVALLGLLSVTAVVDLLVLNAADNFLHLVIAVACLGVGFGAHE